MNSPTDAPEGLPPDRPAKQQSWERTLYMSWFAQLLSIMAFSMVMPFIPFFIRELGVQGDKAVALWAGITITGSGLMLMVFSPIWGSLADRYGRKPMVVRAMFGGAVVLTAMAFVQNVYQLVFIRAIQGALTGTVVASTTLVASVTPRHRLAFSLGLMQTAVLSGSCLGPWMGGFMADHWGYRVPFALSGGLLVIAGLTVLFGVHETFQRQPKGTPAKRGLRKAFGARGLIALLSVFFFIAFSGTFVAPIFPLFVEKIAVGYKPASITGMLMGITGIAEGIAALAMGRLSDRYGHRRLLVCTTFATGVVSIPLGFARTVRELFGLRLTGGLAAGGTSPMLNAIIGTTAPAEIHGRAYGFSTAAAFLGFSLGPLVGALASTVLGFRIPFVLMGVLLMSSSVLVYAFVHPRKPQHYHSDEPAPTPES